MKTIAMLAATLALALAGGAQAGQYVAKVTGGAIEGHEEGAAAVFKGIPYAAAPVGDLRWKDPAPVAKWDGLKPAAAFGPSCPQPKRADLPVANEQKQSEDCLFLNVWAPKAMSGKKPVMVWIHGGAHRFGSGSVSAYDGQAFARDGVVLVTLNYRLGALGYFAHPALTKAASPDAQTLGVFGIADQIAALKWVRDNIAAFGGDPKNVTVFGESAGGSSILWLMAAPSAKGLYSKAIVESGGGWFAPSSLQSAEAQGARFAAAWGLPADATPEQLRAVPVEKTLDIPLALGFGPFSDGRLTPTTATQAIGTGKAPDVPLLIGSNSYEASLAQSFKMPAAMFASQLAPEQREVYAEDGKTDEAIGKAVFTDAVMGGPARWVARQQAGGAPSFLYYFSYVNSARRATAPGAAHAAEIPYVFETGSVMAARMGGAASDQDKAMEKTVHGCWVAFAKTGQPGACAGPAWPAYSATTDHLMQFGVDGTQVRTHWRKPQLDAVEDRVGPKVGKKP